MVFIADARVLNTLIDIKGVRQIEYEVAVTPPPPPNTSRSKLLSQAIPEKIVRGGYKGLTGKNVVIAVLDTGIDFRNPDFISYDSNGIPTSRITYLWDTTARYQPRRGSQAPFKYPNGSSIGTLYTKQQLTQELRATDSNIPATDLNGHGTACTGIAAGNGNADKRAGGLNRKVVEGVAPDADIIGVRLGKTGLENIYLLNAIVEWLNRVAGKKPLVISGSFGGHYSGHDGQRIVERQLDARFPTTKTGRAIVFAAGNEGNAPIHAKVTFQKESKPVTWNAFGKTEIRIYFDNSDGEISIYGTKSTPIKGKLDIRTNPITNQAVATLQVEKGFGTLWFENAAGRRNEAHLYFDSRSTGSFSPEFATFGNLVASPGAMRNAITVGSYDWNDNFNDLGGIVNLTSVCRNNAGGRMPLEIGWRSCYSAIGPNRDGRIKPEILAPGEWYQSSYAKVNNVGVKHWKADSTGNYVAMNGTSAATPYTAGIIALMFQKKPNLSLNEVKRMLLGNATKTGLQPSKGAIPNGIWGYGKLDMIAVDRIFTALNRKP